MEALTLAPHQSLLTNSPHKDDNPNTNQQQDLAEAPLTPVAGSSFPGFLVLLGVLVHTFPLPTGLRFQAARIELSGAKTVLMSSCYHPQGL